MFARYELGEPIRVLDLGFEAMNFDAGPAEMQNKRHPGGDGQKSRRGILLIRVCPVAAPNPKPVVRLYHTARASTRRQVRDHANQRAPGIRWADPGTGGRPPWGVGGRRAPGPQCGELAGLRDGRVPPSQVVERMVLLYNARHLAYQHLHETNERYNRIVPALALQLAYRQAETLRVGFYSLETSRAKLMDRLVAGAAGVELGSIKRGTLSEQQWQMVAGSGRELRSRGLELVEASGMTVQDIQADALAHRYEAVYVDYLQLVEPETRKATRTEQVGAISRGLQHLAHRHGILVVALSQLSRAEKEKSRGGERVVEPTMADLRESGQIEQDADAVLLLYLEDPARPAKSRRVLKLAKNKDGERGRMFLAFDGPFQRFREPAAEGSAPPPGQWNPEDGEDLLANI